VCLKSDANLSGAEDLIEGAVSDDPGRQAQEGNAIHQRQLHEHAGQLYGMTGESLLLVLLGVFVALPALAGYHVLRARSTKVEDLLGEFASALTVGLLSGSPPPSTQDPGLSSSQGIVPGQLRAPLKRPIGQSPIRPTPPGDHTVVAHDGQ
jgi:hypothetical protein